MEYVAIVLVLVLLQYSFFAFMVGLARGKYEVKAPAVTGHEMFERHYRVQQNTLEQLVVFIPGLFLFASYLHAMTAAGIGMLFMLGRMLYYKSYVTDPKSRGPGFIISFISAHVLLIGGLVGAVMKFL
ncbi:MAG: MAPEG family protein [Marinicella sp.]